MSAENVSGFLVSKTYRNPKYIFFLRTVLSTRTTYARAIYQTSSSSLRFKNSDQFSSWTRIISDRVTYVQLNFRKSTIGIVAHRWIAWVHVQSMNPSFLIQPCFIWRHARFSMLVLRCTGRLAYMPLRLVRKAENRIHDVGSCYVVTLLFVNARIASTFSTPSGHEPDASNIIKFQLTLPKPTVDLSTILLLA